MQKGVDYTGITIVYFCHDGNGSFVMNKRSDNCRDECGCWDIGGGGLDFDEKVEDTIRREIKEEYSTEVLDYQFLGFRDVHRNNNGVKTHWLALDFKVLIEKEKVVNGEPHKFEAVEWFRFNSMPDKLHSQLPNFLELYKDKLS